MNRWNWITRLHRAHVTKWAEDAWMITSCFYWIAARGLLAAARAHVALAGIAIFTRHVKWTAVSKLLMGESQQCPFPLKTVCSHDCFNTNRYLQHKANKSVPLLTGYESLDISQNAPLELGRVVNQAEIQFRVICSVKSFVSKTWRHVFTL